MIPAAISRFAAQEYRRRADLASAAVRGRQATRERAEALLRPWLAIACLAHADLPELAEGLADLRSRSAATGEPFFTEAEVRALLAGEIDESRRWRTELAQARDKAILAASPASDPAALDRARHLRDLAHALGLREPWLPPQTPAHPEPASSHPPAGMEAEGRTLAQAAPSARSADAQTLPEAKELTP